MKKNMKILSIFFLFISIVFGTNLSLAQKASNDLIDELKSLKKANEYLQHRLDKTEKAIDDILWHQRVGDVAFIDKVYICGPPLRKEKNPTGQGAGNPVKFWSYVFIPRSINFKNKYPLLVFPHGGVHSNFTTYYTHIIKELMEQQYIVVAAE